MESGVTAELPAAEPAQPLALGSRLRPIVFGGTAAGARNAFGAAEPGHAPHLVLSVHSHANRLLGYVVVDTPSAAGTWGGTTVADDLSLTNAIALARSTGRQLALFGIRRGSHHGLVTVEPGAALDERRARTREFHDALGPLIRAGLCRSAFTTCGGGLEPRLASRAVAASAAAGAVAALESLGLDAALARAAVVHDTPLAREALAAAGDRGLRVVPRPAGVAAPADVLLVASPFWTPAPEDVDAINARVVVSLGPGEVAPATEERLHERGILLVPETISTAGGAVALDLRSRGLDERTALARAALAVEDKLRELLARDEPLAALVRKS